MDKQTILDFDTIWREITNIRAGEGGSWNAIEEALTRLQTKMGA